jgi:hypothetical protein
MQHQRFFVSHPVCRLEVQGVSQSMVHVVHVELTVSGSNNFIFWICFLNGDVQVNTVHVGLSIAKSHYVGWLHVTIYKT